MLAPPVGRPEHYRIGKLTRALTLFRAVEFSGTFRRKRSMVAFSEAGPSWPLSPPQAVLPTRERPAALPRGLLSHYTGEPNGNFSAAPTPPQTLSYVHFLVFHW